MAVRAPRYPFRLKIITLLLPVISEINFLGSRLNYRLRLARRWLAATKTLAAPRFLLMTLSKDSLVKFNEDRSFKWSNKYLGSCYKFYRIYFSMRFKFILVSNLYAKCR